MNTNQRTNDYRQKIADAFVAALEKDSLNWKKGWDATMFAPRNAQTGKAYRGTNQMYLSLTSRKNGYEDTRWATFKQIQKNGWRLQKGAKGVQIEYWTPFDVTSKKYLSWDEYNRYGNDMVEAGAVIEFYPQYYNVFNGQFIDGLEAIESKHVQVPELDTAVESASTSMKVDILNDGGTEAYYRPGEDKIHLPKAETFLSEYEYDATAWHELSHATGSPNRLNRTIPSSFGSQQYAYEELVAEISSAFMSAKLPIEQSEYHIENHAAYVQSWIQTIKESPDTLVQAIRDAERSADYLEYHAGLIPLVEAEKNVHTSMTVNDTALLDVDLLKTETENKKYAANEYIMTAYGERPALSQINALVAAHPQDDLGHFKNWMSSGEGKEAYRLTEHMKEFGYQFVKETENAFFLWGNEETGKNIRLNGFTEVKDFLEESMTKDLVLKASEMLIKEQETGLETGLPTVVDIYFLSEWGENTLPAFENWLQTEEGQQVLLISKQMNDAGFQFQDFDWNFEKMQWIDAEGNIAEFEDWGKVSEYLGSRSELQNTKERSEDIRERAVVEKQSEKPESLGRLEFFTMDEEHQPTYYASPEDALNGFLEENQERICTLGFHFPEIESKRFAMFTSTQQGISAVYNLDVLAGQHPDIKTVASQIEQYMADAKKGNEHTASTAEISSDNYVTKPRHMTSQDSLDQMNRSGVPQDLSERLFLGIDFSNKDIQGYLFLSSQFEHCKFQNTNLTGCNFDHAIIRDCDFVKADLTDTSFYKAELLGTRFKESSLINTRFAETSIQKSVVHGGTILENDSFEDCRISDVHFADVVNRGGHYKGDTAQVIMPGATSEENLRYQQNVKGILSKETVASISPELRNKLKSMEETGVVFKMGGKGTVKVPENADKWLNHAEIDAVSNYIKSAAGKEKTQHRAVGCDCEP